VFFAEKIIARTRRDRHRLIIAVARALKNIVRPMFPSENLVIPAVDRKVCVDIIGNNLFGIYIFVALMRIDRVFVVPTIGLRFSKFGFALVLLLLSCTVFAGQKADRTIWDDAGEFAGVSPILIYGICIQESGVRGKDGVRRPYALTINSPEGPKRFTKLRDAEEYLEKLLTRHTNVDIGMCQINWGQMGYKLTDRPSKFLNKNFNISAAAAVLRECMQRIRREDECVAKYHNPNSDIGRSYALSVYSIVTNLTSK
jgi:hypothetical protein